MLPNVLSYMKLAYGAVLSDARSVTGARLQVQRIVRCLCAGRPVTRSPALVCDCQD